MELKCGIFFMHENAAVHTARHCEIVLRLKQNVLPSLALCPDLSSTKTISGLLARA